MGFGSLVRPRFNFFTGSCATATLSSSFFAFAGASGGSMVVLRYLVSRVADASRARENDSPAVGDGLAGGFRDAVVQEALERRYLPLRGG